ncbi:MAG TPA: cytochrome P450 [Opitutae bacterium]|nr:cytochrome P450 [Opitutaceae bacterium]HCR31608.1 cytochrome P450 [Opitutae bacterium]|tara:strand:+ start:398 stop:1738 length:1341 start_codon:yes stop_codon:yes gene_type:complete
MFRITHEILDTAKYLNLARSNMVAAWPQSYYRRELIQLKFFHKRMFVMNRPEDIQHVMVANASNYRKSLANRQSLKPLLGKGVFVSEGKLWERQRKIMSPANHKKRLKGYAETMMDAASEVADDWEGNRIGGEVDLMEEMTLLTSDIITRTMFGVVLGEGNEALYQAFQDYLASHGRIHISELIGLPSWIPRPGQAMGRSAVRQFDDVIAGVIEERHNQDEPKDDLLQMLVDFREESGEPMTGQLLRDEVASIYLAGHETTAITLTWAFYLLHEHPDIKQRLWDELASTLCGRDPTYEDLPNLPLTRAIVDETLRLYPPVHVFSRQALGDDEISGIRVPKGSFMTISSWVLHRHKLHWEDPNRFDPDRFLPDRFKQVKSFAYIPFGAGPRICMGKHFGLVEATLLLALFAQRFELKLRSEHPVEPLGRMTLRPHQGMPMNVLQHER